MQSPHCIFSKWAEPKYSCRAAQGVTKVLCTECYSLQVDTRYKLMPLSLVWAALVVNSKLSQRPLHFTAY